MNFSPTKMNLAIAAVSACLLAPAAASAADNKFVSGPTSATPAAATDRMVYSDRAHMKSWGNDKEQLERELKLGQVKSYYPQALSERGYQVTSVNTDKPDAVEYEVVKGAQTYEVQLSFDKAGKASKVDVTTNMWRHDATKAAMSGKKMPMASRYERGNEAFSDRARMPTWHKEKEQLEKSLPMGKEKGYYGEQLKTMGYQVTSVNDNEKDYVEYEVVKGGNSYEVQIDFEANKAKDIDVTTNVWQTEATERALAAHKR